MNKDGDAINEYGELETFWIFKTAEDVDSSIELFKSWLPDDYRPHWASVYKPNSDEMPLVLCFNVKSFIIDSDYFRKVEHFLEEHARQIA